MWRFLLGMVVGMAVTASLQRSHGTVRRPARGAVGRVDELSSAALHPPADTESVNAGDGTPAQRAAPARGAVPSTPGEAGDRSRGREETAIAHSSDTFNAA
jgi:hypothetical protein